MTSEFSVPGLRTNDWSAFPYRLVAYRSMRGHGDSECFEANLKIGRTQIARVSNDGWGGSDFFEFVSPTAREEFQNAAELLFEPEENNWLLNDTSSVFLRALREVTAWSKRGTCFIPPERALDWFWHAEFDILGTPDVAEADAWAIERGTPCMRIDLENCRAVALP